VRIVDANVLLYAVNRDAVHHEPSRRWLDRALSGADTVGFAWVPLLAFLRLSTNAGIFASPPSPAEAASQVEEWTAAPGAVVVHPGPGHAARMTELLGAIGAGGNLVNDAHLAAIALEQRAEIVTYDNDFSRFPTLRWRRPADLLP
jgi:toxin-antitoxin system PIN domain toxin